MDYTKTNFLVTLVFEENTDIRKQVDTELAFKNRLTKDLQRLIIDKKIKHFVVADDEVINDRLKEERKTGKWVYEYDNGVSAVHHCSVCGRKLVILRDDTIENYPYCHCGAEMKGNN